VRLLALTAAHPQRRYDAVTIARAPKGPHAIALAMGPVGEDAASRRTAARRHLEILVDLYDRNMRQPVPVYCATSAAYAAAAASGRDAIAAARVEWESGFGYAKEDKDPEHELILGGNPSLAELRAEPPRDDERGGGWDPSEPTRFGRYARRLWDPLLDLERDARRP
jgi:exodeoxyribonuclease V gamma subunit